ncbi:hypothetical protein ISCGN_006861 [Ixodes scapularis]
MKVNVENTLVFLDVVSLFTFVSVHVAIATIRTALEKDKNPNEKEKLSMNELHRHLELCLCWAVGRRNADEKHERTRVSLLSRRPRRPNFRLLQLQWTVTVESDLQQNRRLLNITQLLGRRQDRDRRQHDTSMTSSGGNRGTTFLGAVNTTVGDAF